MTIQVNMHEAKSKLSLLGKKAWQGEQVIIARAGEPYLYLLPHRGQRTERRPGRFKGQIKISEDFLATPEEITSSFYGDE